MALGGTTATAAAVLAVVAGALVLVQQPAAAPGGAGPPVVAESGVGAGNPPLAATTGRGVTYVWPTGGRVEVVRPFSAPAERWLSGHRGADLALAAGGEVRAAGDGVVAFAGRVAGRGVVSIDHADGLRTTYEPVTAVVGRGDAVLKGQVVGTLESQGHHCAPTACLHWGARRGADQYVDPMLLLAEDVVIRLLPERTPRAGP